MRLRLQRQIVDAGDDVSCMVVAPVLIPLKPGERIRMDRRDARKLGELFRAGPLTEVHPPTREHEAARDLCRAREGAWEDSMRCRHRMGKLLLRRAIRFGGGHGPWSERHRNRLRGLRIELDALTVRCAS